MTIALFHNTTVPSELIAKLSQQFPGTSLVQKTERCVLFTGLAESANKLAVRELAKPYQTDIGIIPTHFDPTAIKVLAMDMDSTLINIECVDEIADAVGKKAEVSAITEAAMRGEIKDFCESLRRRVALLKGTPAQALDDVFNQRLKLNRGADELIAQAHARGIHTLLVSGGFTFFTEKLQEQLDLNEVHANQLEIVDGFLTGRVLGDIVDGSAKAHFVQARCAAMGVTKHAAVTMGDGSNDLLMMTGSGLSIGHHAKPIVQEQADIAFNFVGLNAWLDLL